MDASGERDGSDVTCEAGNEERDGLEGVAHDERGFGVGGRRLVEAFDGWHEAAFLGSLDPIGEADEIGSDLEGGEEGADQSNPGGGEGREVESGTVEEVQESVVGVGAKS